MVLFRFGQERQSVILGVTRSWRFLSNSPRDKSTGVAERYGTPFGNSLD